LARAFVNRIWALLVGRGFVHPYDRMDSTHPPSHPELLDAMAADFRSSGYDVKRLVRSIVCSRTYQLASRPADDRALPEQFAYGLVKPLPAESLVRSMLVVLHGEAVEADGELLEEFRSTFPDVLPEEPISHLNQALLLTNHPQLNQLFQVSASPTLTQLFQRSTIAEQVDGAFSAALGREPGTEERDRAVAYLERHAGPGEHNERDQQRAFGQLMWALLTSTEFRLNH
jgi:hypothetical protein